MPSLKKVFIRFDGSRVIDTVTDQVVTTGWSIKLGRKGELLFEQDENGMSFTYVNGADETVYVVTLDQPGEYVFGTAGGERRHSEDELAAERNVRALLDAKESEQRTHENRLLGAGRRAFTQGSRTFCNRGQQVILECTDEEAPLWESDGEIVLQALGGGQTRVVISGATWAFCDPFHLYVWPDHIPSDDFIRKLGLAVHSLERNG